MSDISGPDLTPLFWLAGCLLLGAILVVAVLVFALRRRATQPPREPPPGDDSRWSPESAPQRVGRACATFSKVFVTDGEVAACDSCKTLCHVDCLARHCSAAHGPRQEPFRGGAAP